MIEILLWDVDETLLDFDAAEKAAIRTLFTEYETLDSIENDAAAADSTDQPESAPEAPVKPVTGLIYNEMPQMLAEPAIQIAAVQAAAVQTETAGPDAKIIMYSLNGQTFAEEIPTATNAGKYTVWYKVIDVTSQQTTETGTVTATIEKAEVQLIAPTAR